jgi:hypothetical protein
MRSAKSTGRIVGVLLLLQLAFGLMLPFILWHPLIIGVPSFLADAAAKAGQIRAGVVLSFIGAALTLAIGINSFSIFRRYGYTLALWFLAACLISFTLDAIQNATVMSMLSLSEEYVKVSTADNGVFLGLGTVAALIRRWVHYTQLLGFGAWIFLFYISLLRSALIPRVLACLGVVGILLQFTGVTLFGFLGYPSVMQMAIPLFPIHVAAGLWLIVKGFKEGDPPPAIPANEF